MRIFCRVSTRPPKKKKTKEGEVEADKKSRETPR
jgi:hypothetical protein